MHRILLVHALGSLLATTPVTQAWARDVSVLVSGIAELSGEVVCHLYGSDDGFPHEGTGSVQTVRYAASGELVTCTFPGVAAGRYAVSVMHDVNGNGRLDKSLMGFAKEPWGVSNNVRPANRAPRFGESSIQVSEDRLAIFEVRLAR